MFINKSTTSTQRKSFQKGHMQTDLVCYWWNSSSYKAIIKFIHGMFFFPIFNSFTHQSKPKIDSRFEVILMGGVFRFMGSYSNDNFMYTKPTERYSLNRNVCSPTNEYIHCLTLLNSSKNMNQKQTTNLFQTRLTSVIWAWCNYSKENHNVRCSMFRWISDTYFVDKVPLNT